MAKKQAVYTVQVTFTVDMLADEQLQSESGIKNEIRSWLESLEAVVDKIDIKKAAA